MPKKVTTCAFTPDGRHALAADKFGDVLAVACQRPEGALAVSVRMCCALARVVGWLRQPGYRSPALHRRPCPALLTPY